MSEDLNAIAIFEQANKRIQEAFDVHANSYAMVVGGYLREIANWQREDSKAHYIEKSLPYASHSKLMDVQRLGMDLFRKSMTATNIHNNLNNYIIGQGHTYDVEMQPSQPEQKDLIKLAQESRDRILSRYNWLEVQTDFYNRRFRTGDIFRVVEPVSNTVDFGWQEPFLVRPPTSGPDAQRAKLGIKYKSGDIRKPESYYIADSTENEPTEIKAFGNRKVILHTKAGVDMNDDRGLPLLWLAYVCCLDIDAIDRAMTEVAKAFARYAVVKQYSDTATAKTIKQLADGESDQQLINKLTGHVDAGEVEHAKGYELKMNATNVHAKDWSEMMAIKARRIASIANLPEFMVTGNAETSNRSSLISAEAPFTNRIIQEVNKGSASEVDLFYLGMQAAMGTFGDQDQFNFLKTQIKFRPAHPINSVLRVQNSERLISEVDAGLASVQMACGESGRDYAEVQRDRKLHAQNEAEMIQSTIEEGGFWGLEKKRFEWQINLITDLMKRGKMEADEIIEAVGLDPVEDLNRIEQAQPGILQLNNRGAA